MYYVSPCTAREDLLYSSSKSAAAKMSQTLRLELAPFDVKVMTLYSGGLQTHI